jgi:transcriptional regulator with XRE-family HTH domain
MGTSQFGETVAWRRRALKLTQAELAAMIRVRHHPVDRTYITRIETGSIDPRLSTVNSLARALKIKPWQLVAADWDQPFFERYLALSPTQKREVQRMIDWQLDRRGR